MAATVAAESSSAAECECCGLTEECTPEYIARVRENFHGRWICGLCAEAVKDETSRSDRRIGTDEAVLRHRRFRESFRSAMNPAEELISAMMQVLRRSLDSPRRSSPVQAFGRSSKNCFSE